MNKNLCCHKIFLPLQAVWKLYCIETALIQGTKWRTRRGVYEVFWVAWVRYLWVNIQVIY